MGWPEALNPLRAGVSPTPVAWLNSRRIGTMSEDDNAAAAHRVQVKIDFYLVALTFTVLGFSVQTARFSSMVVPDALELFSWVALLLSGLLGLWRLEWSPVFYHESSRREWSEEIVRQTRRQISRGIRRVPVAGEDRTVLLDDIVRLHEEAIGRLNETLDELQKRQSKKYRLQRTALLVGMVGLILARGLATFVGLFGFSLR